MGEEGSPQRDKIENEANEISSKGAPLQYANKKRAIMVGLKNGRVKQLYFKTKKK